jgi:hypothetical protein
MKTLIVELRAGREVEEIVEYYEAKEHGLGVAFQTHLKSAFSFDQTITGSLRT